MAKPIKKKAKTPVVEKKEPTKMYVLKKDYPTSIGIIKVGKSIEATERGRKILTKQKFI